MLFHLFLNSLLVFCILSLFIDCILRIFDLKNSRICVLCRSLPFLKIPLDILVYGFYGDSLFLNFNPFSCEVYLEHFINKWLPSQFSAELSPSEHLIIPQYIAMQIPSAWLQLFLICTVAISLSTMSYKVAQYLISRKQLKTMIDAAIRCAREITNEKLRNCFEKNSAQLLTTSEISIPFATHHNMILFPEHLIKELTQEEFEAVVAHELEHLRWKDPLLKTFCEALCAFFWWIPTRWCLQNLEADQERASDSSIELYGIETCALAQAIVKAIQKAKFAKQELPSVCHFASSRSSHIGRMEELLKTTQNLQNRYSGRTILGVVFCVMTFFSFWMC